MVTPRAICFAMSFVCFPKNQKFISLLLLYKVMLWAVLILLAYTAFDISDRLKGAGELAGRVHLVRCISGYMTARDVWFSLLQSWWITMKMS